MSKKTAETAVEAANDLTQVSPEEAGAVAVDNAVAQAAAAGDPEPSDETKRQIANDAAEAQQMFLTGVAEAAEALPAQQAAIAETAEADAAHKAEIVKAAEAEAAPPADEPVK